MNGYICTYKQVTHIVILRVETIKLKGLSVYLRLGSLTPTLNHTILSSIQHREHNVIRPELSRPELSRPELSRPELSRPELSRR